MKAVILAAGRGTRLGGLTMKMPKCLLEIDGVTLLERTVALLNEYKINDIMIVVGKRGDCWNKITYSKIKKLVPKMIVNDENDTTHSGYSCALAMETMAPQTFLAIDGDLIFRREALETMITTLGTSLLTRPTSSPSEKGGKVKRQKDRVIYCGVKRPNMLPWDIYSGLMKVSEEIFGDLKREWIKHKDKEILYALNNLCKKYFVYMRRIGYYFSSEGGGGSEIKVMTVVRKESFTKRNIKLAEEIRFLLELPDKWKIHFPEVLSYQISDGSVSYEMPRYEIPSLRRLILSEVFDSDDVLDWIDRILAFKFGEMYQTDKQPVPKDYIDAMHIQRISKRLQEAYDKSPVFRDIIPRENLIINEKEYKNIPISLCLLEQSVDLLDKCLPPYVSRWGHFDMHFANVLVDLRRDNFILVDPRGYEYCDYYYDLGKMWHSAHGLYDLISERNFKLEGEQGSYSYEFPESGIRQEFREIERKLPTLFRKYTKESMVDTMRKVEFNEMCHFCSFMPFFFDYDQREHRALISYLRGVQFVNRFEEKYLPGYKKIDWVNINYLKDWKVAGELEWKSV